MKKAVNKVKLSFMPILPCAPLIGYVALFAASYVFAQLYRSPISAILLGFIIAFGAVDILLFALAVPFVKAEICTPDFSVVRRSYGSVRIRLRNNGIVPISCSQAEITVPSNDGKEYVSAYRKFTLAPFSSSFADLSIPFGRRGRLVIGAKEIFIYDTLRLLRVKKRLKATVTATVFPQRSSLDEIFAKDDSTEDVSSQPLELSALPDYGDIREYRPGDSMKRIHWKLSSKSEELLVRKYASETESTASVYCNVRKKDLKALNSGDGLEAEDRVIEYAYSVALKASESGYKGDLHLDGGTVLRFGSQRDDYVMGFELATYKASEADTLLDVDKAVSPCVFVFPFVNAKSGGEIMASLKLLPSKNLKACVLELSAFVNEQNKQKYYSELSAFTDALKAMGITVLTFNGGRYDG